MARVRSNRGKKTLAVILGLIWGIIVAVIVADLYMMFNYKPNYYSSAVRMADKVSSKTYGQLYGMMQNDLVDNLDTDKQTEYAEVLAIHDYMEAAAQYRMYSENGISDMAARYKERMDEAESRMGGLDFAADDIDKIIGEKR